MNSAAPSTADPLPAAIAAASAATGDVQPTPAPVTSTRYDFVVVGGGLSGLAFTLAVARAGKTVALLEGENARVGGRVESVYLERGVVERGGTWVAKEHTEFKKLCRSYDIEFIHQKRPGQATYVRSVKTTKKVSTGGKKVVSRDITVPYWISPHSVGARIDILFNVLNRIWFLSKSLSLESPWTHPMAEELDSESVHSYFRHHTWTNASMQFVSSMVKELLGCEAGEVSFLYFLFVVKSLGGLEHPVGSDKGARRYRVKGGAQRVCEAMLKEIHEKHPTNVTFVPGAYVLSIVQVTHDPEALGGEGVIEPTSRVATTEGAATLPINLMALGKVGVANPGRALTNVANSFYSTTTAGNNGTVKITVSEPLVYFHVSTISALTGLSDEFFGNTVVVSSNPAVFIRQTRFSPGIITPYLSQLARRAFNGAHGCAFLVYPEAWWIKANRSGTFVDASGGLLSSGHDVSIGDFNVLAVDFTASAGVAAVGLDPEKRRQEVVACLKRVFPGYESEIESYTSYDEKLWSLDPYAQGSNGVLYPPGSFANYSVFKLLREGIRSKPKIGNAKHQIFFIGSDVSPEFVGTMEGALRSAKAMSAKLLGRAPYLR